MEELLRHNCRFCKITKEEQWTETQLHCSEIWLHSVKYSGPGWSYKVPPPAWAAADHAY
jgi:hypothetical protein